MYYTYTHYAQLHMVIAYGLIHNCSYIDMLYEVSKLCMLRQEFKLEKLDHGFAKEESDKGGRTIFQMISLLMQRYQQWILPKGIQFKYCKVKTMLNRVI